MEHRMYLGYREKEFTDWANTVGLHTAAVVNYYLTSGKEPEQGYKCCASLAKLADRYSPVRLENACQRLLSFSSTPSVRTLNTILKNGQDRVQTTLEPPKVAIQHGITHGADYFRRGGGSK